MKKILPVLLAVFLLTGCNTMQAEKANEMTYTQIDQETAKEMMEKDDGHVIVDVRRQDEYDEGHIPGAILIPNESIGTTQLEELPDLGQIILVYCRSGNRSKQASEKLAAIGYTNIYEFGGINTWTGEIVTGEESALHSVIVTIESNPTTGFSWEAVQDTELFEIEDSYTADPQDEPVSGSGGVQKFKLNPVKTGTVQVTFTYLRSWEPSDMDTRFSCVFEIDEELQITLVEDGSKAARDSGFYPEIHID